MSEESNVIPFPKENIQKNEEFDEKILSSNILDIKVNHINEALMIILPSIFNNIDLAGFPPSDSIEEDDVKDINLIVESLRSLLCKYYDVSHPFQNLAEKVFEKEEFSDEYALTKKLDLEFDTDKIGEDINIQ
jgi:hypothetical protein|tara:strand:- start:20222 stop:20620 length:399 start_codon:yes stop_codon:yes gene_type:complete